MYIAGYFAAVLIGISLGLIGGGGSVLTVPVLVYLFHIDPLLATSYSLFIVGTTSVVGSVSYIKKKLADASTVVFFGIPSVVAALVTRALILPAIPDKILETGDFTVTKNILVLLLFAVLMLFASYSMIKNKQMASQDLPAKETKRLLVVFQGIFTGLITGFIGAGGGFLIIPALVNLLKIPIKTAIGTSLIIISVNSLAGFLLSFQNNPIDWKFLLVITTIAVSGIITGSYLSTKIDGKKLKPAFGWFILVMGIYILVKEIFIK